MKKINNKSQTRATISQKQRFPLNTKEIDFQQEQKESKVLYESFINGFSSEGPKSQSKKIIQDRGTIHDQRLSKSRPSTSNQKKSKLFSNNRLNMSIEFMSLKNINEEAEQKSAFKNYQQQRLSTLLNAKEKNKASKRSPKKKIQIVGEKFMQRDLEKYLKHSSCQYNEIISQKNSQSINKHNSSVYKKQKSLFSRNAKSAKKTKSSIPKKPKQQVKYEEQNPQKMCEILIRKSATLTKVFDEIYSSRFSVPRKDQHRAKLFEHSQVRLLSANKKKFMNSYHKTKKQNTFFRTQENDKKNSKMKIYHNFFNSTSRKLKKKPRKREEVVTEPIMFINSIQVLKKEKQFENYKQVQQYF